MNCNKIFYDKDCNTIVQEEYEDEYAFVYILQLNQTTGPVNQVFIKTNEEQEVKFDLKADGFYTLVTLKIPFDNEKPYYYMDNKFYNSNQQEVELAELVYTNPETSQIDIHYDYYFQDCKLRKCYIKACQEIFDSQASIRCNQNSLDQDLIHKRDLLWSTINVINYMVEFDQFEEAQRLLERITGCNGLCENSVDNSCGCS